MSRLILGRVTGLAAGGCAVMGLACCGASTDTSTGASAQATSSPTAPHTPAASSPEPAAAGDPFGLTGLGTLETVWNSLHQLDKSKSGGDAYLPAVAGGGDTWASVGFAKGPGHRLYGYDFQTGDGNGVSAFAMKASIHQQLPSDAVLLGDKVGSGSLAAKQCETEVYQSALLGRAFATDPSIGDAQGFADVVLTSSGTSDGSYDSNQVDGASVTLGSGPSDLALAC